MSARADAALVKRPHLLGLALLGAVVAALPFLGLDQGSRAHVYDVVAAASLVLAWSRLRLRRDRGQTGIGGWRLLLSGYSCWVLGDLVWDVEHTVLHSEVFPAFSDVIYLSGYALLAAGAVVLVRSRDAQRDLTALLDGAVLTAGVAVPVMVFVISPIAADSSLSLPGKLVSSAYPIGDLLLIAVLARLGTTPGARSWSFAALAASLLSTLVADIWFTTAALLRPDATQSVVNEALWLSAYVLIAVAVVHPSRRGVGEVSRNGSEEFGRPRLVALAIGSLLPAATLLAVGLRGGPVPWLTVSLGGGVLSALVLTRMAGLLLRTSDQATRLAALARSDDLTGAPNRRSWDHELSRACEVALATGGPLSVAILDLDHFKAFNDAFGHPAGDRLLCQAVSSWTELLGDAGLLTRYGGEEVAVLMPHTDLDVALTVIERLRPGTPSGQTFSAGIARWEVGTEPGRAVAAADLALYNAKRAGRNRVDTAQGYSEDLLPECLQTVQVALQVIGDLATGAVAAHEVLSRFEHSTDIPAVFAQAHREGHGDILEATVVAKAVELPGRPHGTELFVNVSAAALTSERFWGLLPTRLDGVVVELVEDYYAVDWLALRPQLDRLLDRGARLAVDDLGAGAGDLTRMLTIKPKVVKVDRAIIAGCATDPARRGVLRVVTDLVHAAGAKVCAEGIEEADDLEALREVGVDLVQGYLLGRPGAGWTTSISFPVRVRI